MAGITMRLAVPTMGEAGLDATRSAHFGRCDYFTIIDIDDGEITKVSGIPCPPHEQGGCMRTVNILADAGVTAVVAAGMGMGPFMGFNQAGITVLYDATEPNVGKVTEMVIAGKVPQMSQDAACNHHHQGV